MKAANYAPRPLRVRRLWRAFFVSLALIGLTMTTFAAAQPLTGTYTGRIIGRDVTFDRNGNSVTDWSGVLNLRLDNGVDVPVFCIEVDVLVRSGDRYRSDGPITQLAGGCEIRYLLDHYPASNARTVDEAAARQMAIWVFSDGVDPMTIPDTDASLRARVNRLVAEAKNAPCPPMQVNIPELTLEPPTASATAGQPVTYTVRAGPGGAGQTVNITVTGPAVLQDGQQQGSVTLDAQGNATFTVTGTDAGSTTVSVALPYQLDAGVVFSHIEDTNRTQRLVTAGAVALTATATAQANWAAAAPTATPVPPRPTEEQPPPQTPVPAPTEAPAPTAEITPTAPIEQPAPTVEAIAPQPAGGAGPAGPAESRPLPGAGGPARPQTLPNTGEPDHTSIWLGAGLAALLLGGGWLLRRRVARR